MSLPEGFFGPPRPQPAIPQTEDDYLAALFQLDQEQAAQPPDPTFSGGATPGFLERFGTALQGGVPQAPGAAGSFISGLAGSLAGQGQKVAAQRAQFEQTMEQRRRERDAQNLEASREKRRTLLAGLNETRSETRRLEREARERKDKFHVVTDADVKAVPGLGRFKGTEVPIDWVKPETASDAAKKAPKPPTPAQLSATNYYNRANAATAQALEGGLEDRISARTGVEGFELDAPNALQGDDAQAYNAAIKAFGLAFLRKESGAAISDKEYRDIRRAFFYEPGDKPATLARKKKAREEVLKGLQIQTVPQSDAMGGESGPVENPRAAEAAPAFVAPPTWKRVR